MYVVRLAFAAQAPDAEREASTVLDLPHSPMHRTTTLVAC